MEIDVKAFIWLFDVAKLQTISICFQFFPEWPFSSNVPLFLNSSVISSVCFPLFLSESFHSFGF